ncbi:non-ribosomal peptide synthetase [Marinimicrobium locisalis]|uniref:non-ribosomal peptide synthetase n=1 Tax=Marinimicrobium locisalis TaxID=546022 RepID=UPI003221DC4C
MSDIQAQIEQLSPEKRKAFEALMTRKRTEQTGVRETPTLPVIEPDPEHRFEPFPLTDIQQAQWFGRSGLFSITVAGHGYVEFDCKGKDLERLEKAFQVLIERHDQMRMVVLPNLKQQVLKEVPPYRFIRHDLRGEPEETVQRTLAWVRDGMSHEILPTDQWPIFKVSATQWDEDNLRIHFSFDLLVGDAWCFRVLIDEWARLYDDPEGGRQAPTELTYRDYVLGLQQIEQSYWLERDLAYWREQLEDLPPGPELPMMASPEDIREVRAEHYSIRLDREAWGRLRQLLKQQKLTPSGFFACAFSEILTLWNSRPCHTLNMTVFNRLPLHPEVNDIMVGEFNSFQLLKIDNSGEQSFAARASALQSLMWEHLEHRYISGVRLMRELARMTGAAAGEALMPVVFTSTLSHQEDDLPTRSPGTWVYEVSQTPQVWMEHHLWEEDNALALHIDVVEGMFPPGLIQTLVDTYEQLILRLLNEPQAWERTNASYLLPDSVQSQWDHYNNTEAPVPEGLLHEPIFARVKRHPEKTAIVSARGNLSYSELEQLSNKLGNWLQRRGVGPNELVAVVAHKGWEQVAGALGVLKSGGAYLPVDKDQPAERLADILATGGVRYVITSEDLLDTLSWPESVERVTFESPSLKAAAPTPPTKRQAPEDTAYVIFTSGSTGKPKGVTIDHRGALNTVVDINRRFEVNERDVFLAISSLSFDLSVYDLFGGLAAGATLVFPDSQQPDPKHWLALCQQHGVTVWNSVPALLEMLVDYAEERAEEIPESLRLAMVSGDWVPLSLKPRLELVNPEMHVISLGGATEASIWSIYHPIEDIPPQWRSIPYGKPLANQTMHVLDHRLSPCPCWVQGEVYIGGLGVAQGYWGDDAKTAAAFITHPETGERLYRTGDMGRLLPEGYIEFLGRRDTQVKIRGFRVELGEIESRLGQLDNVKRCAVIAAGESNRDRQLIAFVVPEESVPETSHTVFTDALRQALAQTLPDYMVPERLLLLEQLPLSANGKVDRKKLPAVGSTTSAQAFVAPTSDTEKRLAAIWCELLNVERVGIHDDFFQLGGNSLIASNLLYRINDVFEVELPLADLFDATIIAALATLVEEQVIEQVASVTDEDIELMEDL